MPWLMAKKKKKKDSFSLFADNTLESTGLFLGFWAVCELLAVSCVGVPSPQRTRL